MEISNFNQPEKSEIKLERNMRTPDSFGSDYLSEFGRIITTYACNHNRSCLEWGMGNSTRYFLENRNALNLKDLYSIDHTEEYFNVLLSNLPKWENFYPFCIDLIGTGNSDRDDGYNYASYPLTFSKKFDVIYIDGRRRMECAFLSLSLCHSETIVILHDYRRLRYQNIKLLYDIIEDGNQFRVMKLKPLVNDLLNLETTNSNIEIEATKDKTHISTTLLRISDYEKDCLEKELTENNITLQQQSEKIKLQIESISSYKTTTDELKNQLNNLEIRIQSHNSELINIKKSFSYKLSRLFETSLLLFNPLNVKRLIKGKLIVRRNIKLLKQNSYFDTDYYLKNNPDVKQTEKSAIRHYLIYGGFEGRNPSEKFNSSFYLKQYPDVKASGLNPLLHFAMFGKDEKRTTNYEQSKPVHTNDRKNSINNGKNQLKYQANLMEGVASNSCPVRYSDQSSAMLHSKALIDFSQAEAQDILTNIFKLLPTTPERWCVEFGAWDGIHLINTFHYISHQNWNYVLIEQDPLKFELIKSTYRQKPQAILINKKVNLEGLDSLDNILATTSIPLNFDLLSIGIDGNVWHVWDSAKEYSPKVVVIRFNPTIPVDIEFVEPRDLSVNQGTSLLHIVNHAKEKGYELINATTFNAFFIHKELYPYLNIKDNSIQALWKTKKKAPRLFHPFDGTLVLDDEFKMPWSNKVIGKFDLQIIPESKKKYQPSQLLNRVNPNKTNRFSFLQNSIGVIHAGANRGQEKDIYQEFNLSVLWIEASPDTFIILQQNIEKHPTQIAIQALLSDVDEEEFVFHISNNNGASSSIFPLGDHEKFWPQVEYSDKIILKSETLSTLLKRESIDLTLYDTMVLDTQGSELKVLMGSADLLWGIHTIYIETTDCELYTGGCYDSEIEKFLKPYGFVEIDRWLMKTLPETGSCFNVLYQKLNFINPNPKAEKKVEGNYFRKERFRILRNILNNFGLPPLQFQTEKKEIENFIKHLKPYYCGYPLKRLGPDKDGGYLIPDDLRDIEACYSPGVGNEMGFEKDCYSYGMKIFLADKSIVSSVNIPNEFHYIPKYLGKETANDFISLPEWLITTKRDSSKELLLQMDIQGFEYETLEGLDYSTLNKFRIIVIELHFLDLIVYKPMFDKILPIIKLLTTNHTVAHLHPNNCCGIFQIGSLAIPKTLEVTLLRNDRLKSKTPSMQFPHPLDRENTNNPSLELPFRWYRDFYGTGRIKAIVMTYDRNAILTEHMIKCYEELWPNHPFIFRIPFQDENRCIIGSNREYVRTSPAIKETVLTLLEDLDDEEWIYWCIDDRYPAFINTKQVSIFIEWIKQGKFSEISGLLFCRAQNMAKNNFLTGESTVIERELLLERKAYYKIWMHQFIQVKVIRTMFKGFPDIIIRAALMDPMKNSLLKPINHKLFVTNSDYAHYEESTIGGVLTVNCLESLKSKGFKIPDWHTGETVINPILE